MAKKVDIKLQALAVIELRRRKGKDIFWEFCLYYDYKFFSKRQFLKQVADAFQRVYAAYKEGGSRKLAVSMPPRAGKSYISSLFVAWMLGNFPEESVMRNCCSDTLYQKFSYDTRDVVKSIRYQRVFPDIKLSKDKQNVRGWNIEEARQVSYFGGGVGGTIIGFGASMLAMTDDLYKSLEEALSDTINEKTWSWKQGTHDSRVEKNCCYIDIGTRWSENDVLGRMEKANKYNEIIRIAALDDEDETFCEDVHTTEYYRDLREETDSSIWEAEYQQNPIEAKGLLFPKSELKRFKLSDIQGKAPSGTIGACDVADKGNDDLCAPIAKIFEDRIFIPDIIFTKDAVEITEPRLGQLLIDTKCDKIRIESNNGGRIFANNVRKLVPKSCEVQARPTTSNKETRILMKSGYVKANFYFLEEGEYKKGSDYDRFIKMLTSYKKEGGNSHDDAPDGITILAEFITQEGIKVKTKKVAKRSV